MRDYAKASPTFWTGETGRQIRAAGRDVQVVAFYLYTCPSSNWIGLYYLPLPTLCYEVGISERSALQALGSLAELDFAHYDRESGTVWVPGMAKWQVGESLKERDKKIKGIVNDLRPYLGCRFARDFYERYWEPYHLPEIFGDDRNIGQASKPLRSTESESESESEAESESAPESEGGAARRPRSKRRPPAVATHAPESLEITDSLKDWASRRIPPDLGIDLNGEVESFLTKARAKGWTNVDWHHAFRNWLLKAVQFAIERRGASGDGTGSRTGGGNGSYGVRGGSGQAHQRKPFEGAPAYVVGSGK